MAEIEDPDTDISQSSVNIEFSAKSWFDHCCGVCRKPAKIAWVFFTAMGVLWLFAETAIQFVEVNPRGWYLYALLITISVAAALAVNALDYRTHCQVGFEGRSRRAAQLAHLQPPQWETRLTQVLMAELVIPIDREYQQLLDGNDYVIASRHATFEAYHRWREDRNINLERMIHVSRRLLTTGLTDVLGSKSKPDKKALEILGWVESVARLYRETVSFEKEGHAVLVPNELQHLHSLLADWSEPVRDAIRQCLGMLHQMSTADLDTGKKHGLGIVYKSPPNVDEALAEYARLADAGAYAQIISNW